MVFAQETEIAGLAGDCWPCEMKLAGNEVSLFLGVAGCVDHSEMLPAFPGSLSGFPGLFERDLE